MTVKKSNLVIRNGTIIDGTGNTGFISDLEITDGIISAIGKDLPIGTEEIDATGKLVTPGFIDVHTHYDAQVTWSSRITPSSWNGVTTVMIGNCGVGFAPCKPDDRDKLVELMEGVEDIPEPVLTEGLPWNWETFEEYLDSLDRKSFDLDVVAQVPHAAIRVYVMGERGVAREDATEVERTEMAQLVADGIRAGALGFSTSRTINHRTVKGAFTPTLGAAEQELMDIAKAFQNLDSGWLQVISDFDDPDEEMNLLNGLAKTSGRPMTITILQRNDRPELWRETMSNIANANANGSKIFGQVLTRPTGVMLGFQISLNPFMACDAWREIEDLPHKEKVKYLKEPEFKRRLLTEPQGEHVMRTRVTEWDKIFPLGNPPEYEPFPETSIAHQADACGCTPEELAYDMLMENNATAILYRPLSNYAYGNLDTVFDMMNDPNALVGLGDGGAHVGVLTDASAVTYMLTYWARDRPRGARVNITEAIKRLTSDNANAIGLKDRGVLKVGKKADINVINFPKLKINTPEVLYDLPSGGRRMVQRIEGYDATIVSGEIVSRMGKPTEALPGRLVRGPR
jgi:N-acyl-D-aspartate/D-glutamate deacylase